jgi:hypothetical protein
MAYNTFSLDDLKQRFDLRIVEEAATFAQMPSVPVSDLLRSTLAEHIPLALAISTEKARSEMLIVPILIEVRRQLDRTISLFSGVEFNVDPTQGLNGVCDYLLSLSREQLTIEAPIIAVVEAKNENIKQGINQCIAEMVAAQVFNEQKNNRVTTIYGVVTTGSNWKFLSLTNHVVAIDSIEYYINNVEQIVGIIVHMARDAVKRHETTVTHT